MTPAEKVMELISELGEKMGLEAYKDFLREVIDDTRTSLLAADSDDAQYEDED